MSNNKNNSTPVEWKVPVASDMRKATALPVTEPSTKFTTSSTIVNNGNEDANNFTKTGASGWSNGEVTSKQSFVGDGFVIAKIATIDSAVMFGLTASPEVNNAGSLYQDIDYGAYFRLGKMNEIYESGTRFKFDDAGSDTTAVTYNAGDSAKVARIGTEIKYYHIDGEAGVETLLKTTTGVSADTELYFDAAFYYKGDTLEEVALHKIATTENESTAPSVVIHMEDTELTAGEHTTVTFVFNEAPTEEKQTKPSLQNGWATYLTTGNKASSTTTMDLDSFFYNAIKPKINSFGLDDIVADNGILSNLQVDSANPNIYTATFTSTVDIADDTNVIRVGTDWVGVSGNMPTAVAYSDNYTISDNNDNKEILAKIYEDSKGNEDGVLVTVEELSEVATGVNLYLESRYQNAIQAKTNFSNLNTDTAEMIEEVQALINTKSADLSFLYGDKTTFNDDISDMNTSLATSMYQMFFGAHTFNQDVSSWDVSNVKNMEGAFSQAYAFDQDISSWNVSNVTNMSYMFGRSNFNQDISSWDMSNVRDTSAMFAFTHFNQDISSWDVGNVTRMSGMFYADSAFNQDISDWDVGNVVYMGHLFQNADAFNQSIGGWDVSNVTGMNSMFYAATAFNQDINGWDVGNVKDMSSMFSTTHFNQDIGSWDVSSVTGMSSMFYTATAFNQDIGGWDVGSVSNIKAMFYNATTFNQDIGGWDVGNAVHMGHLFQNTDAFNQDIGSWDVSSAMYMENMFQDSRAFNQDIGNWNIASLIDASHFLDNSVYTTANFDQLLAGWSDVNVRQDESIHMGVIFDAKGIQYTNATAREYMTGVYNWKMTDGGLKQDSNDNGINDVFVGSNVANTLEFDLYGEAVTLHGLDGDDLLRGSAFNDQIYGGAGDDTLVGNAGADTFVYSYKNAGHDIITDFNAEQGDKLDLKYLLDGYNGRDISNYITATSNVEDDLVLNIRANGNEEGSIDIKITLEGVSASSITPTWIDDNVIVL